MLDALVSLYYFPCHPFNTNIIEKFYQNTIFLLNLSWQYEMEDNKQSTRDEVMTNLDILIFKSINLLKLNQSCEHLKIIASSYLQ